MWARRPREIYLHFSLELFFEINVALNECRGAVQFGSPSLDWNCIMQFSLAGGAAHIAREHLLPPTYNELHVSQGIGSAELHVIQLRNFQQLWESK